VPFFVRWPAGKVPEGAECNALSAHLDLLPTIADAVGVELPSDFKKQVEGRSLFPLFKQPTAPWADRLLVHHVGRWNKGQAEDSKYKKSAIQNARFTLVNNKELYDLQADPGETTDVSAAHPEVVSKLSAAYDDWWKEVQPFLVNESAVGPKINPLKEAFWKQFGGGPDEAMLKRMDPSGAASDEEGARPKKGKREQ
jgi:arylsulfatase